jgi:ribonuclease HII
MALIQGQWAGFDEVGRGCLAGSVIAAAVILPENCRILGLTDSKKLSPKKREDLALLIREQAIAYAIGRAEPSEIDHINILKASLLSMERAFQGLSVKPLGALIDGNRAPSLPVETRTLIGGDRLEPAISAASILAKVARDFEMVLADQLFPGYSFGVHKGYPTQEHQDALQRLGPSPIHRKSFGPVKAWINQGLTP